MVKPMARSCSRPSAVMSAGRQAGIHCQSTRKSSTQPSTASSVRIWHPDDVLPRVGAAVGHDKQLRVQARGLGLHDGAVE
jgi:hypothetical protein